MATQIVGDARPALSTVMTDIGQVLAGLAISKRTARDIYTRILEETTSRYGWCPNGAQLIELVRSYNATLLHKSDHLPMGSAQAPRDALADFQRFMAKATYPKLNTKKLPESLVTTAGSLFDQMVTEIRAVVEVEADAQIAVVREACAKEIFEAKQSATAAVEHAQQRAASFEQELASLQAEYAQTQQAHIAECERAAVLVSERDDLGQRYRRTIADEAVARTNLANLQERFTRLEADHAGQLFNAKEENRIRMLTVDKCRQLEIALATEKATNAALLKAHGEALGRVAQLHSVLEAKVAVPHDDRAMSLPVGRRRVGYGPKPTPFRKNR